MTDLEMIIVCWNADKIKFNGTYIPVTRDVFDEYVAAAEKEGKKISHGICPDCMKQAVEDLDYKFIEISKDYLGV